MEQHQLQIIAEKVNFHKRLKLLGYSNYNEYLKSDHWKNKKLEYHNNAKVKECLVCGNPDYVLHHRSYTNLGDESIYDFIPLCIRCHEKIHQITKTIDIHIYANKIFRLAFKFSRKKTREIFRRISCNKSATRFKDKSKKDILKSCQKTKSDYK